MKFTIDSRVIQEGVSVVTRALAPKPPTPVLEGMSITADDNKLTLTCSDGQLTISWAGEASISEPGTAIIPGRILADLARKFPATRITLTADDKSATVTYNKSRSRLAILPGPYPDRPATSGAASFTLPASTLRDLCSHVAPCIATDTTRPILTGALLDVTPSQVTAVSLDGFRLALMRCAEDPHLTGQDSIRAVIPGKTISELARIIPNNPDPVQVSAGAGAVSLGIGTAQITSTLLAGEYIDYAKIIPTQFRTSVLVHTSDLQDALDRANLMAREGKNNLIRLDLDNNTLYVSSRSDTGDVQEEVDCDQQGDNLSISFNSRYIADALRNSPDETVTIGFNSPSSPAVFSPQSSRDWLYLVLPVRTN